ncbi:MAG: LiaF domain-containing protein [Chitinophagaceae bacterium]
MNDFRKERRDRMMHNWTHESSISHVWTGVFILLVGGIAMAKSFGVPVPKWLFSWQMLLIGIGIFTGFKRNFRDGGWFVPIIVGGAFLVNDYVILGDLRKHIWPLVLIVVGAVFILRPKKKHPVPLDQQGDSMNIPPVDSVFSASTAHVSDDYIDSTCIFSGNKKIILSKNFRGGDLVNIFGGCEVDLTQADMTVPAVLEVTAIFGGATLIVPSNWAIQSEAVTIFGGISDKRKMPLLTDGPKKTLVLKGTMIFGGMEIKSY